MSQVLTKTNGTKPLIPMTPIADTLEIAVPNSFLAYARMIEAVATNPELDVAKLERLLQMQNDQLTRNAELAFNAAMTKAQSEMRSVVTDAHNPTTHSRYASYNALDRMVRPIYTANGFALSFNTGDDAPPEHIRILCDVTHSGGFSKQYKIDMPTDGKGAKGGDVMTKTHATGAGAAYGSRYLLKMIWNIAVGEDDVDGNAPGSISPRITEQQAAALKKLCGEAKQNMAGFFDNFQIRTLEELPADRYAEVVARLEEKKRQKAAAAREVS